MKTIYNIIHIYDVDGGIGDAIQQENVLFATENKKIAEEFVAKYSNEHIYDTPYQNLYVGKLIITEVSIIENYNDIPAEIIEWGEKNISHTDDNGTELFMKMYDNAGITLEELVELDNLRLSTRE